MMDTCTGKVYTKRRRRGSQFQPRVELPPAPRPRPKTKWVIAMSNDGTEHCLTGKDNWDRQPKLRLDTNGRQMRVIDEFEAASYQEAREIYEAQL